MMEIKLTLNGRPLTAQIEPDCLLIDFLRAHGCPSVKRGCETSGCGLCTVLVDGKPVLSCSMLRRGPRAMRSRRWRACRPKPPVLWASSPGRAPTSAAFATPAL